MASVGFSLSPIGFGAFKIGRNEGAKYPDGYEVPDVPTVERLLNGVLDLGVNYIDTAPAYGVSEERIGLTIAGRRDEYVLSTKVGEVFENGRSRYDVSDHGVRNSIQRSLVRLRTDMLDIVFVHASRDDLRVIRETNVVSTLSALRETGLIRAIGLSGHTAEAFRESFGWADAIMVTFNRVEPGLEPVIQEAAGRNITVIVKKGLSSGRLSAPEAVRFVLGRPEVTSMVVGTLNLQHLQENLRLALEIRGNATGGETRP
jgi:aryl-alcohol dehydrogenase-like predicted oxidoreductase